MDTTDASREQQLDLPLTSGATAAGVEPHAESSATGRSVDRPIRSIAQRREITADFRRQNSDVAELQSAASPARSSWRASMRHSVPKLLTRGPALAGLPAPAMQPWDRVELVRRTYANACAEFGDSPRTIAARLGIRMGAVARLPVTCEVQVDDTVLVEADLDKAEAALMAWHGIAHVLTKREGWEHTHADVWLLSLELAAPLRAIREHGADPVLRYAHAPAWALRPWLDVAQRLERCAA
jgi:hypothetical protein